jgi:hypothetical protein
MSHPPIRVFVGTIFWGFVAGRKRAAPVSA